MKILISNGTLYLDNQHFCFAEVKDGCTDVRPVARAVVTQYSPDHGDILPRVADYGWIGAHESCRIILGRVRFKLGAIPCRDTVQQLAAIIEACEDLGKTVTLEIANG